MGLFLYLYNRNTNSCPGIERTNKIIAQLSYKLYSNCSPTVDRRIRKSSPIPTPVCEAMFTNHRIIIWRNIFVTAANQKNEANRGVKKCIFYGTPSFCNYVLFLFCCSSALSIMKYDGGRFQDGLFCFKIPLRENLKNLHLTSVPEMSLSEGTLWIHLGKNVVIAGNTSCIRLCACGLDVCGMHEEDLSHNFLVHAQISFA